MNVCAQTASQKTPPDDLNVAILLENTSDAVILLDREFRYEYVNHAAELLLRRKHESLLGRCHWDEYTDLLGTTAEAQLRAAFEQQRTVIFEQFIPPLYAWHSVVCVPSVQRLTLFCRDITDRVRALRDAAVREGMRSVLEHVPVAVTITRGLEHRIELQNAYSRALLNGRSFEGSTVSNALPEAAEQGFIAILDKVYHSGEVFSGTEMALHYDKDSTAVQHQAYFDLTYQPIFDTNGKVSGILHLGVDVTERRMEKDILARYAAERDATLRQLSEGVILTDSTGHITFVNERAAQLHGVAVLDIGVESYTKSYQLLTLEGAPYPPEQLPLARAVLHGDYVVDAQWCIQRPDGTRLTVEGSAQPIYDERQQKIACVLVLRAVGERPPPSTTIKD